MLVAQSSLTLWNPVECVAHQAPLSTEFSRQEYWSHSLLQGIFLTQGSNLGLLHCRWILYCRTREAWEGLNKKTFLRWSGGGSVRACSVLPGLPRCHSWVLGTVPLLCSHSGLPTVCPYLSLRKPSPDSLALALTWPCTRPSLGHLRGSRLHPYA